MAIDWGDVATWVTGLFTAGSLLLGFYIILHDRNKEESAQARRIFIWHSHVLLLPEDDVRNMRVEITIWNRSDAPIYLPQVHQGKSEDRLFKAGPESEGKADDIFWLHPDQRGYVEWLILHTNDPKDLDLTGVVVAFSDLDGQDWYFTLANRALRKYRPGRAPWGESNLVRLKSK